MAFELFEPSKDRSLLTGLLRMTEQRELVMCAGAKVVVLWREPISESG